MGVSEMTDCAIFRKKKKVYRKKPYTGNNILTLRGENMLICL